MIVERSTDGFRVTVPCKVNLFLEVLGKRIDGYHSLDTVMMAVSLADELEISHRDDGRLLLSVELPERSGQRLDEEDLAWSIPADQNNLILRALERLRVFLGQPHFGADIRLIKHIPAMAGLGGGSADAAAALVLGTLLWTEHVKLHQIATVASQLGSDVNFFLESHRNSYWLARCTGRGEEIECLQCKKSLHFVIVHPPRGCGTKQVFDALRLEPSQRVLTNPDRLIHALGQGDVKTIGETLTNRLEQAAAGTTFWIDRSRMQLNRYDHHGQCLSGSGSARFCLCTTREQAEKIASEIRLQGEMRAYCVQSWQSPSIEEQIIRIRNG
jgi:4-diphosphocytidyl-2-C-methyl-D-erythritol kinase